MRFASLPLRRAVSTLTAATALGLGVTLVAAPTASAKPVGSSACTENVKKDPTYTVVDFAGTTLRERPSHKAKKVKALGVGDAMKMYCARYKGEGWYYGKAGKKKGWAVTRAFH